MNNITYTPKAGDVERLWFVVDATDKVLGRLASEIAQVLRGKRKPQYAPHADVGDHVIVINAEKIKITGNKAEQKVYYRHTHLSREQAVAWCAVHGRRTAVVYRSECLCPAASG